jgi:hypothetical protein
MGRVGIAYNDADYQNTGGSSYNSGWSYRNDGVDIERCTDPSSNGYNVGWTGAGESLSFTVQVQTGGLFRINVHVSSGASGGTAKLNWDGNDLSPALSIPGTGGWQAWTTLTLGDYHLSAGTHDLRFNCVTGGYNVGRMEFSLLATGVEDEKDVPLAFSLQQNYPNPFNPTTRIRYTVGRVVVPSGALLSGVEGPASSNVSLVVYDVLGREVAVLVDEKKAPGSYEVRFDASGLASGVYYYRLAAWSFVQTRKMILLK